MSERFVYVTYIRTTAEKLWKALLEPEFTRQYWCDTTQKCDWKPGASWQIEIPGGELAASGEVLEIEPQKRLVLTWRKEGIPEMKAEGYSKMTYELEQVGASMKLTVIHEMEQPGTMLLQGVSNGWPLILASLKSLLETGESLVETRQWNFGGCATQQA